MYIYRYTHWGSDFARIKVHCRARYIIHIMYVDFGGENLRNFWGNLYACVNIVW